MDWICFKWNKETILHLLVYNKQYHSYYVLQNHHPLFIKFLRHAAAVNLSFPDSGRTLRTHTSVPPPYLERTLQITRLFRLHSICKATNHQHQEPTLIQDTWSPRGRSTLVLLMRGKENAANRKASEKFVGEALDGGERYVTTAILTLFLLLQI